MEPRTEAVTVLLEPTYIHYTDAARLGVWWAKGPIGERYLVELPRLLADGHQGKFVTITKDGVTGLYADHGEAQSAFRRGVPGRVYDVSEWHKFGRLTPLIRQCPDTSSPLPRTA